MKLQENIIQHIELNEALLFQDMPLFVQKVKKRGMECLMKQGFPTQKDEKWRKTKLKDAINKYYHTGINALYSDTLSWESCIIPESDEKFTLINGHCVKNEIRELPNGIIIGSINEAINVYPDLVEKYFDNLLSKSKSSIDSLNAALFSDGLFLYVPASINGFKLQLINRLDAKVDALINIRNLIIVEENAKIDIIQCDDSNQHRSHFATFNSEVFLAENAKLNWYKYQNINNISNLLSTQFYKVDEEAELYTNFIELNGKLLRNEQVVDMVGVNAKVDLLGLFLSDKQQQVDNVILVNHLNEKGYSNQKFKGILDDSARGFFNGQIYVNKVAQQTNAFQKNDNILLTDKARISSQPFLEIYADDVSCSHGSTTGQIDEAALFYIRQRGISKRDAQLLQLYAFVGEVIDTIKLDELVEPTKDLIKKRLNGELDACENCILQCIVRS